MRNLPVSRSFGLFIVLALFFTSPNLSLAMFDGEDSPPKPPAPPSAPLVPPTPETPEGGLSTHAEVVLPEAEPLPEDERRRERRKALFLSPNTHVGPLRSRRPIVRAARPVSLAFPGASSAPGKAKAAKRSVNMEKKPQWGNSIYMIAQVSAEIPVVDLQEQNITEQELLGLVRPLLRAVVGHRYIGKTTREVKTRFKEHAKGCETNHKRRLQKKLAKSACARNPMTMRVIVANAHPDQLGLVELWLIEWFGGTDELGLNSCVGASEPADYAELEEDLDDEDEDEFFDEDEDEENTVPYPNTLSKHRRFDRGPGGGSAGPGAGATPGLLRLAASIGSF